MSNHTNSEARQLYTAVEFGTESIKVLIGMAGDEQNDERPLLIGTGETRSNPQAGSEVVPRNIRKGEIHDITKVREQLRVAIEAAQAEAGVSVADGVVVFGLPQNDMTLTEVRGEQRIAHLSHLVSETDMFKSIREAHIEAVSLADNKDSVYIQDYTKCFELDSGRRCYHPIGQPSDCLHTIVEAALCSAPLYAMLSNLVEEATNVKPQAIFLPMALSAAVLSREERDICNLVIDIGAGLTSFSACLGTCFLMNHQFKVGCNQIENDIMKAFNLDWSIARHLLRKMPGELQASIVNPDDRRTRMVKVNSRAGRRERQIPISSLEKVVAARLSEILGMVREKLTAHGIWSLLDGQVVLTGGAAMIPGIVELAEDILERPVRIGEPLQLNGYRELLADNPRFLATASLLYAGIRAKRVEEAVEAIQAGPMEIARKILAELFAL